MYDFLIRTEQEEKKRSKERAEKYLTKDLLLLLRFFHVKTFVPIGDLCLQIILRIADSELDRVVGGGINELRFDITVLQLIDFYFIFHPLNSSNVRFLD